MFIDPEANVSQFELMPNMVVADLGAGVGHYALPLAKALHGSGKVYAVDVNDDLLGRLHADAQKAKLYNIQTVHGDIEHKGGTRLADGIADLALAANTLFQVKDRAGALAEVSRILKKNGRLILIDWRDSYGGIGPHHKDVLTETQARDLLGRSGFDFVRTMTAGEHHYGLIFRKTAAVAAAHSGSRPASV